MRVEATTDSEPVPIEYPLTLNSKMCGQPGEYIIVPPIFFTSPDTEDKYGDIGRLLEKIIQVTRSITCIFVRRYFCR